MLRLYYADVSGINAGTDGYILSDYRLDRLESVKSEKIRRQGIGAELLLNCAVTDVCPDISLPLDVHIGKNGKPFLPDGPFFSLSHSGSIAACAISDAELGLDVQFLHACSEDFVKRFFTASEHEHIINADDKDYAFTMLWSLKESYLKAVGTGLNEPLNSFSIVPGEVIRFFENSELGFWHSVVDGFHFALCQPGKCQPVPELIKKKLL